MSSLFGKKKKSKSRKIEEAKKAEILIKDAAVTVASPLEVQRDENKSNKKNNRDNNENGMKTTALVDEKEEEDSYSSKTMMITTFEELGLCEPLAVSCRCLGYQKPTPVQKALIPYLLQQQQQHHVLALAATGTGKTASFVLPILQNLSVDPYGVFAIVATPTRELAKQIHQQVLAFGHKPFNVQSTLIIGGMDIVKQSNELYHQNPHIIVATPGRLAEILRGPQPPRNLKHLRYMVFDEADRLFASNSGFERDVAELLLHTNNNAGTNNSSTIKQPCQTLFFSATMTRSLQKIETYANAGQGRLPLKKFIIQQNSIIQQKIVGKKRQKIKSKNENEKADSRAIDGKDKEATEEGDNGNEGEEEMTIIPKVPAGLKQEYVFMPSRVRDAYLLTLIRHLVMNGGQVYNDNDNENYHRSRKRQRGNNYNASHQRKKSYDIDEDDENENDSKQKARLVVIFVSTCERCALISTILTELGIANVALHSLLSQNRRLAALAKFQSEYVRVMVATDIASRGLDIPLVDLIINCELPRNPICYIHRVGRTARAGKRGRSVSLVGESDVLLFQSIEQLLLSQTKTTTTDTTDNINEDQGRKQGKEEEQQQLITKCMDITDDDAIKMLGPVTKATRLAKMKLMDIGFNELVVKMKERKVRGRKERERIQKKLRCS